MLKCSHLKKQKKNQNIISKTTVFQNSVKKIHTDKK